MVSQFHVQHITKWSPCAVDIVTRTWIHPKFAWQDYLHSCPQEPVLSVSREMLKPRYSRMCHLLDVFRFSVEGLYVPDSDWHGTSHHMSDRALIASSVRGSSLHWLLADFQHVGVDMEADVGEVLLLRESRDVKAHLLGRERHSEKNIVKHRSVCNVLHPRKFNFLHRQFCVFSICVVVILPWFVCCECACSTVTHNFTSVTVVWQGHGWICMRQM